jgi:hypothetical protein
MMSTTVNGRHSISLSNTIKAAKAKATKVSKTKATPKNISETPHHDSTVVCSPPAARNRAIVKNNPYILKPAEQLAFKKYINVTLTLTLKNILALVLLKCGLGLQEVKCISKKMQED